MNCLSESQVLLFLEHSLSAEERAFVEEHIDVCTACRDLLADAALCVITAQKKPEARKDESLPRPKTVEAGALPIGATLKHYEIIRQLGRGGMGRVYLARDLKLGRLVAIKLLVEYGGSSTTRLIEEARATAKCRHDNIVIVHEVDEQQGFPYMVLEHIEGSSLRAWMEQRAGSPVPLDVVLDLVVPIVRALECAHEEGVVHRDLKPENVLISNAGTIKVLDFGIAKQLGAPRGAGETTQHDGILGTLPYMAPEQQRGEEVDAQADLWAVGIVLYELCTGAHPLAPLSMAAIKSIRELDVPMPLLSQKRADAGAMSAIVGRCLAKKKSERFGTARELLAALEALRSPWKRGALTDGDVAPFAGLAAFQEADTARFFGRDQEVTSVMERLRRSPLLAVTGPTGAGKSSFVRAGVIPALKHTGERWEAYVLRPGQSPLASLAEVLAVSGKPDQHLTAEQLRQEPGQVGALLREHCRDQNGRVLLFIDQFEELYTLGASVADREAFVSCIEGVADDASSPLRVMLAIRSDFLDRMAEGRRFTAEVIAGLVLLPAMGRSGLREVLTRPVEVLDHRFEDNAFVEQILDALDGARSPLPLLQFTAMKLWEARDRERRLLTRSSYEALGGIAGALSAHAGAVIYGFSSRDQRLCREILLRLITPERTRAVVRVEDLYELAREGEDERAVERVVHQLVDARLLTIEGATVELMHESLIERWPQLRRWIEESAEDAPLLARLRAAAQQWESGGEVDGLLWRDEAAQEAIRWLSRHDGQTGAWITSREQRFLNATVTLAERAQRRRRQALAGLVASLVVVAVLVSLLGFRASQEAARAREQAARADQETARAREQALRADKEADRALAEARDARNATRIAVATRELREDPTTALAVLRELEPPNLPPGWSNLAFALMHDVLAQAVFVHSDQVYQVAFSPDGERIVTACGDGKARVFRADGTGRAIALAGHDGPVVWVAFSPEGDRIATASTDKTARIFRADGTGEPIVFPQHGADVTGVAFSPEGTHIVTGTEDGTVRVFRADGSGQARALGRHRQGILSVAFSPDGKQVVSASKDASVRVWNADGTGAPLKLLGHDEWVFSAAFSADGKHIITSGADRTARVFPASGKGTPRVFRAHDHLIYGATLSPDGTRIATASFDKTARIAMLDGTGQIVVLRGHTGGVRKIVFSPDGKRVATASQDGTARIWDASGGHSPVVLRGHTGFVSSAAFDPTGRSVVTSGWDNTARVWNSDGTKSPLILEGHTQKLNYAVFSPDGRRILTASNDGTARVFDANGGPAIAVLAGTSEVNAVSWSPDGTRIVTASMDGKAQIWNADGSGQPVLLEKASTNLTSASWSPDGARIATSSGDHTARIWNADGSGQPTVLKGHDNFVVWTSWSPDGKRLVSGSWDKTARIWKADGSEPPVVLAGHRDTIWSTVFSPDGTRVLTASQDKTARLWNADGMGESIVFEAHPMALNRGGFSPDGTRIVTASDDGTARIWSALHPIRDPSDATLWSATTYCLTPKRRQELLQITEEVAETQQAACRERVERVGKR